MPAYIYIIQVNINDTNMYKVGMCRQEPCNYIKRLKCYPKTSNICMVYLVPESQVFQIEEEIICMMNSKFKLAYGKEYFQGNEHEILLACHTIMYKVYSSTTFDCEACVLPSTDKSKKLSIYDVNKASYEEIKLEVDRALQENDDKFCIMMTDVSRWLNVNKHKLCNTLKASYQENNDFIITKNMNVLKKDPRANNNKMYLLTKDCFRRVCMLSHASNSDTLRRYFIEKMNTHPIQDETKMT